MIRAILPLLLLLTPATAMAETRVPTSQSEISMGFCAGGQNARRLLW